MAVIRKTIRLGLICVMLAAGCLSAETNAAEAPGIGAKNAVLKPLPVGGMLLARYASTSLKEPRAVALMIHGLNLRPEKMAALIKILTEAGIEVFAVFLRGHGSNYLHAENMEPRKARLESLKTVSLQIWMKEAYGAYGRAQSRSDRLQVPLFFIGFSFGGLLGTDLLAGYADVKFDRMILLAPALSLRLILYSGKILSFLPQLVIPSLASNSYRQNRGLPIAAYNALYQAITYLKQNAGPKLNIPTLVFIDRADELISPQGVKQIIADYRLDRWHIYFVQKQRRQIKAPLNHLIIDEPSVGGAEWRKMKQMIVMHLLSPDQDPLKAGEPKH